MSTRIIIAALTRKKSCAVVLGPDQRVSFVTEVDDYKGIDQFFLGFMVEQKLQNSSCGKGLEVNGNGEAFVDGGSGQMGVEAGDEATKGTGGSWSKTWGPSMVKNCSSVNPQSRAEASLYTLP